MRRGAVWGLLAIAGLLIGMPDRVRATATSLDVPAADDYARAERALRDGHIENGLGALEMAARRGGIRAQIRLAKIYAEGKLVPRDEVKACELYGSLADRHSHIDRTDAAAKLISEAFRAWAMCYVKGAPAAGWEQNPNRAALLFYHGGVILDDAESLHELAKMYLTGQGIAQNNRLAVYYFFKAARKRHPPAQALLGSLMWEGRIIKRQSVPGLALMLLALEGAKAEDRGWVESLYQDALLTASQDEEADAIKLAADWKKTYGPDSTSSTSPLIAAPVTPVPPPVRAPGQPPATGQRQIAAPPASPARPIEQQNTFGTMPTGANVPPAVSPLE